MGFNPSQSRIPAGSPNGGEWAGSNTGPQNVTGQKAGTMRPTDVAPFASKQNIAYHYTTTPHQLKQTMDDLGLHTKTVEEVVAATVPNNGPFDKVTVRTNPDGSLGVSATSSQHGGAYMIRSVGIGDSGTLEISNDYFYLPKELQGGGLGTKMFASQVEAARELGVTRFTTNAARAPDMNGYSTWPKLGYDAPLSQVSTVDDKPIPRAFAGSAKTLTEFIATKAGRTWWERFGNSTKMEFDLHPDSPSSMILANYVKASEAKHGKRQA